MVCVYQIKGKLFKDRVAKYDESIVVKNPLAPVEHKGGAGIRNELFERGLDQFIRGMM